MMVVVSEHREEMHHVVVIIIRQVGVGCELMDLIFTLWGGGLLDFVCFL